MQESESLKKLNDTLFLKLQKLTVSRSMYFDQVSLLKSSNQDMMAKIGQLECENDEIKAENYILNTMFEIAVDNNNCCAKSMRDVSKVFGRLNAETRMVQEEMDDMHYEFDQIKKMYREAQRKLLQIEDTNNQLQKEVRHQKTKLDLLQEDNIELEKLKIRSSKLIKDLEGREYYYLQLMDQKDANAQQLRETVAERTNELSVAKIKYKYLKPSKEATTMTVNRQEYSGNEFYKKDQIIMKYQTEIKLLLMKIIYLEKITNKMSEKLGTAFKQKIVNEEKTSNCVEKMQTCSN